jgi:hypothetical protein
MYYPRLMQKLQKEILLNNKTEIVWVMLLPFNGFI